MEIKNRHHLRDDKAKEIRDQMRKKFEKDFLRNKKLEQGQIKENEFILVNGKPFLTKFEEQFFPNVLGALEFNLGKKTIIVDQGAVPHVVNGADIMAPGIVDIDKELTKNELAIVKEEEHGKSLAVVKMLIEAEEVTELEKGKVAKNIHHIRDDLWETISD